MRGPLAWILAIVAGVVVVLIVTATIGHRDARGDTVTASAWAQDVCGAVGVWRGEMKDVVNDIRVPSTTSIGEEPQSETTQGRTGFIRKGLERSVEATKFLVEGIDNAGAPDTPEGKQAAAQVSDWADSSRDDLNEAQDSLDKEADSLEGSVTQLTGAAKTLGSVLATGVQTIADVARLDPELAAAINASSTCQELRKEKN